MLSLLHTPVRLCPKTGFPKTGGSWTKTFMRIFGGSFRSTQVVFVKFLREEIERNLTPENNKIKSNAGSVTFCDLLRLSGPHFKTWKIARQFSKSCYFPIEPNQTAISVAPRLFQA